MIYLRKSSLRAAACRRRSGQITLWIALCFLVFLGLYLVCLKSVQIQYQRKQAEQAVEAGVFSMFSEFEPHILEQYDLFYLDTSFGGRSERKDALCSHLWQFTVNNMTKVSGAPRYGLSLQGVDIKSMVRATDGSGAAFYRQAVQVMKEKTGMPLAEDWILQDRFSMNAEENSRKFQEDCETYEGRVRDYEDEDDEEDGESRKMDPEARQWDGLWNRFILSQAVPGDGVISEKAAAASLTPSHRELSVGAGLPSGTENRLTEKQWFISYLCEYFTDAEEMLKSRREEGYLDYQLEYMVAGKESDRENLEAVITRLLLLREGSNYLFLLSTPELRKKAEGLALLLAGMTGNLELVESLEHLILLSWAYGESLVEVRQLLGGFELAPVKSVQEWQVPLSGLLAALGDPGRYDEQAKRQTGISYEMCLRIFLSLESAERLSMRALDLVEGELRSTGRCPELHMDHCVDYMTVQVWINDRCLERSYGYE